MTASADEPGVEAGNRRDGRVPGPPAGDEDRRGDLSLRLLGRRARPGVVDIAQVRALGRPRIRPITGSPMLGRLLARRGAGSASVAAGQFVWRIERGERAADGEFPSAPALRAGTSVPAPHVATAGHAKGRAVIPTAIAAAGVEASAEVPAPLHTAGHATAVRPSRAAPFRSVADESTAAMALPPVAGGIASSEHPPAAPVPAATRARPRELPGPAIGSDLLLPPHPQAPLSHAATSRRRREDAVQAGGEPVVAATLPLAKLSAPAAAAAAGSAVAAPAASARTSAGASAPFRPAAVSAPPIVTILPAPEPRALAESVGRELVRSVRRARERKGIPPWKN